MTPRCPVAKNMKQSWDQGLTYCVPETKFTKSLLIQILAKFNFYNSLYNNYQIQLPIVSKKAIYISALSYKMVC